jgi:DNA-binding Lrp family transcriptional regulator
MDDCWSAIDGEILATLTAGGPVEPAEIARRLGVPEPSVTSLICGLVSAGKVRVRLVEAHH